MMRGKSVEWVYRQREGCRRKVRHSESNSEYHKIRTAARLFWEVLAAALYVACRYAANIALAGFGGTIRPVRCGSDGVGHCRFA